MPRPGIDIISRDLPVPRAAPTDTDTWFVVGMTTSGPTVPTLITSITQYATVFGARGTATTQKLYDAIDAFFREGGSKVWVCKSATVTAADVITSLAQFTDKLGPGQVSVPGISLTAVHQAVLDHLLTSNRVGLLEAPQGNAVALQAAATALATHAAARYAALFAPQAVIPGVAGSTTRTIGFTSIEAGIIARNDRAYNPNVPAAGTLGISLYALDLSDAYTDAEYTSLNTGGVDLARNVYGTIEAYGYRTLVDPTVLPLWWNFGHSRLNMAIVAQANQIAERYVFKQLDGRGRMIADFGGELSAMLAGFYEQGALYGNTAREAFSVNVGPQVNTPTTIANGELHAILSVRMSPFAEYVVIEIVKVATTEALAA